VAPEYWYAGGRVKYSELAKYLVEARDELSSTLASVTSDHQMWLETLMHLKRRALVERNVRSPVLKDQPLPSSVLSLTLVYNA
jgi:hypothetical protein